MTDFPAWFLLLPFVLFCVDVVLSWVWQPIYFQYGLPIFWQHYRLESTRKLEEVLPVVIKKYTVDTRPIIEFQLISPENCAFQEKVFAPRGGLTYPRLMHGCIHFEANSGQLLVIGFAKWYVIAILWLGALWIVGNLARLPLLLQGTAGFTVLVPAAILMLVYGFQAWRYYHVGKTILSLLGS